MKFNIRDLNEKKLIAKSNTESDAIYAKPSTRNGRTLAEVRQSSLYGLAAEQFLIEKCGFNDDPREFKDVFSPSGVSIEVKVTSAKNVGRKLSECDIEHQKPWRNFSDWLFIFESVWASGIYNLRGTYHWDGSGFADKAFPWKSEANTAISMHEDELWLANPVWAVKHNA
jgi:hypothetical protein